VAQEVAALRMRKSMGSETRVQRKKTMGKQSPKPVPDARLKGISAAARLECRARRVSEMFTHARTCPGEIGSHSRDAAIPVEYRNLQSPCAIISNGHVRHVVDMPARPTSPAFTTSPMTVVTATTTMTTTAEHSQDTTATMKLKSPRASLQLTHELRGYIRRMRSRAPTENTENSTNTKPTHN
jgi:hypothetical protein